MYSSYVLSALAAAGLAAAQCSTSGTLTIQNSGDATGLASCQTYSGTIAIATGTTDDINISGITKLDGDLIAKKVDGLSSLGADSLEEITGTFQLDGLESLSTLTFPQLTTVGTIDWTTLNALNQLSFDAGVDDVTDVSIIDTQLANLDGIKLSTVNSLKIQSNGILKDIDLELEEFKTEMIITNTGDTEMNIKLPKLTKGATFTLQNVASLEMPELKTATGALAIEISTLTNLSIPKIEEIQSTFTISHNANLESLDLGSLTTIDDAFIIFSCPKLTDVSGVDKLETIGGALDMAGNFESIDLPALKSVKGAFNVQSTGDITEECKAFKAEAGENQAIRGKFRCNSKDSTPENVKGQTSAGSEGGGEGTSITEAGGANFLLPSLLTIAASILASASGLF